MFLVHALGLLKELLHLVPIGEITDADAVGSDVLTQLVELVRVRIFVDAVDRCGEAIFGRLGDGLVGDEHELLDELVGFIIIDTH